ncbi:DUF4097 family beta strand repeat-containing protein [Streptococcaceae bacterium ESL0729]|nr:DUF4097 family beta strand repeat-containing protein [Streptococcaceae bacterium ESL0729]
MQKKERILDLMRHGVISNEEAIELLENIDNKKNDTNIDTGKDLDSFSDIFAGFDPKSFFDSEEVIEEYPENQESETDQKKEDGSKKGKSQDTKQDKFNASDFSDSIGEAMRSLLGWGSDVFDNVKTKVDENFEWDSGKFKVKSSKKQDSRVIEGDIRALNIISQAGDIEIIKSEDDRVKVDFDFEVYGSDNIDDFLEKNILISDAGGILTINVASKRVSADMVVSLPAKRYDSLIVRLASGDVAVSSTIADYIRITSVSGDLELNDLSSTITELSTKNGDLKVSGGSYTDLNVKTINGDLRVNSDFETSELSSINGAIRLAPSLKAKKINIKNINGDIKMSIPSSAGFTGLAKTSFGKYKTRLELDNPLDIGKSGVALVRAGHDVITFEIESKMGNIWLKDADLDEKK